MYVSSVKEGEAEGEVEGAADDGDADGVAEGTAVGVVEGKGISSSKYSPDVGSVKSCPGRDWVA